MASLNIICDDCGNKIIGLKYTHSGKNYCYACYQKLQDALLAQEQQKQHLYSYIKELFSISDVPSEVILQIDKEIAQGKKLKGMELTLKYYYVIEGHPLGGVGSVPYILKTQYEAAKQYAIRNRELQNRNAGVDLNIPPKVIKIDPASLGRRDKEFTYNIEDL